ncbi:hypothetical protein ES703_108382 [subsurface metagenome]
MAKKGKCPSLVTGNHGKPVFEITGGKRKCKRCGKEILKGVRCVRIPIPGRMGSRTYCCACLSDFIGQSRKDLDKLEDEITAKSN